MSAEFLPCILAAKRQEVLARKQHCSEEILRKRITDTPGPRSLAQALSGETLAVIAEIKKASPSAGVIRPDFDPSAIARSYIQAGADAMSVLTDEASFQGSLTFIEQIRPFTPLPILRKDFIVDTYQLFEARAAGADAVLLIVAALTDETLRDFIALAGELQLDALVEVHSSEEMRRAADAGATLLGVNNRDLRTFEIDLTTTERLAPLRPAGALLVGESGIHTAADVRRMMQAGVDAILVGTHFMSQPDPGAALHQFRQSWLDGTVHSR